MRRLRIALLLCVPALYVLWEIPMVRALGWNSALRGYIVLLSFLSCLLLCAAVLGTCAAQESHALRRHFQRTLNTFGEKLKDLSPELLARMRALASDPWQAYCECENESGPFIITCGCVDCLKIFHADAAEMDTFPACPRCGADAVVYAAPGTPLTAEMLRELHNFFCEET